MGSLLGAEKAHDFKGSMKKLIRYIADFRAGVIAVVIFAAASTVFTIYGPKLTGKIITKLAKGLMGGSIDFTAIRNLIILAMGLYVVSALLSFIQGFIMTGISQKVAYRMRRELSEKIDKLPMNFFDKRTHGEILSRVTNDVDTLSQSLNQSVTTIVTSVATLIGVLIMMLSINVWMTLIALLMLPVSAVLLSFVIKKSQKHFSAQQEYLGHVNGQVEEVYSGHNVVKAFNREAAVSGEFDTANTVLYQSAWKSQFLSGMMMPIMMFVGNLGYVAITLSGAFFAAKGSIAVGDITAFIQYIRQFTQPVQQIAQVAGMLQSTAAAAERIFEFLGEEEESGLGVTTLADGTKAIAARAKVADVKTLAGSVEFEHVHFGYDPEKIIINDFSAHVKEGQKVAIVGPTGAGKTTIVKLLMRFYDLNSGAIKVDGCDMAGFDRGEVRKLFGMVLQDTWLFKGTIMENIRYGRLDATDEEVIAAAKSAHVHNFIKTLPGGYEMELNEDATNVSQGQKQLLTIARAILAQNKIMILDEATSSVDTRTEIRIQKAMDNLLRGRTSFVIAHRLSTIRDADLILVMKDGDIIELGSHDELMAQGGFYCELYNSQFDRVS
ncbi:MAG: ABC transporter ATP-binding protein [Oscillospiraceae bacterium]